MNHGEKINKKKLYTIFIYKDYKIHYELKY